MSKRSDTKGFLLGTLAGGVIGSVAALLLAPKSGKELRGDISAGAQKVSDQTVKVASQVGDTTGRIAKQISGQAVQFADRTKQVVINVRNRSKGSETTEGISDSTALIAAAAEENELEATAVSTVEAGETEAAATKEDTSLNI